MPDTTVPAAVAPPSPHAAPPVDYLVARTEPPLPSGLAYDYVLAGDGLFVSAQGLLLRVRVPAAPCRVRGLTPLYAGCTLTHGRLPLAIWEAIAGVLLDARAPDREVLLAVTHNPASGYRLVRPLQAGGATRVVYERQPDTVLELHSHGRLPACFSLRDDLDEQRLSLFGVVGQLDRPRPEIRLRAGAYGYFLPLPWESVFCGTATDLLPFRDAHAHAHANACADSSEPPDPARPPPDDGLLGEWPRGEDDGDLPD